VAGGAAARTTAAGRGGARARRARLALLVAGLAAGLLALAARCAHLQVIKEPELLDLARSQQERTIALDPRRGPILDRNGKELAVSLDVDSIFADPVEVGDAAAAGQRLAPLLGQKPGELRERLENDRHFVWLRRKVTPDLRRRVEALDLSGVGFARESRRYYPKRTLAAHLLGGCGMDNQGLAGLEFAYDATIRGTPGRILFMRDGRGGRVLDRARTEPTAGLGLVLTVDEVIQYIVERELDTVMAETSPAGATVVALRPQTGEVLALASRPTFDPNSYSASREEAQRNRAVSDYYEPGSTFKVVTAAAALEAGRVNPNEVIWCENGSIVVARHRFKEDRLPYGNLTFTEVLAKSSNVGAIKVAARLRPQEFIDVIRSFGFGHRTGIELPGESPGMLRDLPDWSGLSQASIAMGQEVGATTLQLAAAMGTIANDGVWVRPRVVQATMAPGGRRIPTDPPDDQERHRAVSERTARTLRRMLQSVTIEGGTGRAAAVPGYTVGGKTGTAQKIDASGRYSPGKYVSWFAGFVPSGRPALVIVVMVDEPRGPKFHGGDIAAPVFSRVALPVLQYLGVPPDTDDTLVFDRSAQAALRDGGAAPGARSAVALSAVRRTRTVALRPRLSPAPQAILQASLAALPLGASRSVDERRVHPEPVAAAGGAASMPDLGGMSLRQASETLAMAGMVCTTLRGGPRVTRQEPAPGASIQTGTPCTVIY
jgi:cell division protein FtsI/penicillin-binding protein 2